MSYWKCYENMKLTPGQYERMITLGFEAHKDIAIAIDSKNELCNDFEPFLHISQVSSASLFGSRKVNCNNSNFTLHINENFLCDNVPVTWVTSSNLRIISGQGSNTSIIKANSS